MNRSDRIAARASCVALTLLVLAMMTLQSLSVLAAAERLLPCWSFEADSELVHFNESLRGTDDFPISAYLDTGHRTIVRFDSRGEIERQTPFPGEAALLMRAGEPLVVRPRRWTILSQPHYRDGATGCYQVDVLADSAVEIERLAYATFNECSPGYLDANWTFAKQEARVSFGDGPVTLPYRAIHSGLLVGDRLHAIGTLVFEVRQAGYRSWSAPLHYLSFTNQGDEVGDVDLRVDGDPTTALWGEDGSVALLVREHPELTRPVLVVARPISLKRPRNF